MKKTIRRIETVWLLVCLLTQTLSQCKTILYCILLYCNPAHLLVQELGLYQPISLCSLDEIFHCVGFSQI